MPELLKRPLTIALAFSLALHAFILLGIGFVLPDPREATQHLQSMQVVLVNSITKTRPTKSDVLAQNNLDGGGNTSEDRHAKSPLPALGDAKQLTLEQSKQRVQDLERGVRVLLTQAAAPTHMPVKEMSSERPPPEPGDRTNSKDLVQRNLEIVRLDAQISKDFDTYQKLPRRRFIGARAQEYRFAQYVEDWRTKVERVGNLNYPQAARNSGIYGKLQLTVSIRADGSLENVEVSHSSQQPILDAAAVNIVRLAAPFSPLPANIRKDTDVLTITRTWTFTSADTLQSE